MNELQKLYDVLVREGKYTKSFEEFQAKWNDQEYRTKVYDVVTRDGLYTKDRGSFDQKYGGQQQPQYNKLNYQAVPEQPAGPTLGQQVQENMQAVLPGLEQKIEEEQQQEKENYRNEMLSAMKKADEAKNYVKKKAAQEKALQEMQAGLASESMSEGGSSGSQEQFDPSRFDPNILNQKVDISSRQDKTFAAPNIVREYNAPKDARAFEKMVVEQEAFNAKQAEDMAVINEREAKRKEQQTKRESELNRAVNSSPAFNILLNSIDGNLIGKEEEDIISALDFQFGRFGFVFSESGAGDNITVRTSDGKNGIEIKLDNWTNAQDIAESERLKEFIREFSKMPKEIELAKKQENLSPVELEADAFYKSRGLNYFEEKNKWETYTRLRDEIEFIKEAMSEGSSYNDTKARPDLYAAGELRPDIETYLANLERQRDGIFDSVFDAGFIDIGKVQKTREDFDIHLNKLSEASAKEAADINLVAQTNEFEVQTESFQKFGVAAKDLFNVIPKDEAQAEELKSLQDRYYSSQVEKDFASRKYDAAKTYFDGKLNKEIVGDYEENWEAFKTQVSDGWARGQAADEILAISMGVKDINNPDEKAEAIATIVQNMRKSADLANKKSRVLERTNAAVGWKEWGSAVAADPFEWATSLAAHSITEMLPYGMKIIPAAVGTGGATGAAIGAPAGGVGAVPGFITGASYGFKGGMAATGFAMEYTNAVFDAMRNRGYDLLDPQQVEAAMSDPEVWEEGARIGTLRGIPIATVDLLSSGLAGRVFKTSKLAAVPVKIATNTAERMVFDPFAEATGELLAQVSAGQKLDWKEIAAEAGGAMGNNSSNMAVNLYKDSRNNTNIDFADKLTKIGFLSSETASDSRISNWANNMEKLGKIDADVNQRIQENVGLRRDARDILSIGKVGRFLNKSPEVVNRTMELLAARQELSATTNRRELNRAKISAINEEINALAETKKLLPVEESVDLSLIIGTTRRGTSQYIIDGKRLTKDEFMYRIGKMKREKLAKLDAEGKIVIRQDTDAIAALKDAVKPRGSRVNAPEEQVLSKAEIDRKAELEEALATRAEDEKNGITSYEVTDGKGGITKVSYAEAQKELDALNEKAKAAPVEVAAEVATETTPTVETTPAEVTTKEVVTPTVRLTEPTMEERLADAQKGNLVTFKYENDEQVPEEMRQYISSRGETNGVKEVRVTIPKVLADYLIQEKTAPAPETATPAPAAKSEVTFSKEDLEGFLSTREEDENNGNTGKEYSDGTNKVNLAFEDAQKILDLLTQKEKVESAIQQATETAPEGISPIAAFIDNELVPFGEAQTQLENINQDIDAIKNKVTSPAATTVAPTTEVAPAPKPKTRGRKKTVAAAPAVAPTTQTETKKTMTREEVRAKEEEIAEENRKAKESKGENIKVKDFKRTKKRGQDLKIGDVYVRRIGDSVFVFKVLSKLRNSVGQFYDMDVEILHVGNHVNRKEVGPDGEVREGSWRVGNKIVDGFKNMLSGTGKFNFGEVTVLENFEQAPEAKTEVAPAPAPAVEVVAPAVEVATAPTTTTQPAPAKTKAEEQLEEDMVQAQSEIDYANEKIAEIQEEIAIEKSNTKDKIDEVKEKIAKIKATVASKTTQKRLIQELKDELENFKETQENQIGIYNEDLAEQKADLRKAEAKLKRLETKKAEIAPAPAPKVETEQAPVKRGFISMVEVRQRFPLAAEFIDKIYGKKASTAGVTGNLIQNLMISAYENVPRSKKAAIEFLKTLTEIEKLGEELNQDSKKVTKAQFKKQLADSGDFNAKQLRILNALIDSLQTEELPQYIITEEERKRLGGKSKNFYMNATNQIVSREADTFIHEIGHFGFFKILTGPERVKFYEYMINSTYGKTGVPLKQRLAFAGSSIVGKGTMGQVYEAVTNVGDNFAEYFAEQFSQWYMKERMVPAEIDTMFEKIAKFYNLVIEKLKSGKYVDKNLTEYFNKLSAKIEQKRAVNEKKKKATAPEPELSESVQELEENLGLDFEDEFGLDDELSPMNRSFDTPLVRMAKMYNMKESGFFQNNVSTSHVNRDFYQFGLESKQSAAGTYYLVDINTKKMVNPFKTKRGGGNNLSRMARKITDINKKRRTAKDNVKSKIGVAQALAPDLFRLFSVNPQIIPDAVFDQYSALLDAFTGRAKVLPLPEINAAMANAQAVLAALDADISQVESLAIRMDNYTNKVFDSNGNLDFDATITNMKDDGTLTEAEYKLIKKHKKRIMPKVSKPKMTAAEEKIIKDQLINDIKSLVMKISGLATRFERDAARKFESLLTDDVLEKLSISRLSNVLKLIDNINNGYFPHYAQLTINRLGTIKEGMNLANSIRNIDPLRVSKFIASVKAKLTKSEAILEMIRRTPIFFVDQVFGDFKSKNIYNAVFQPVASAYSSFKTAIGRVNETLDRAQNRVAKSYKYNSNKILESSFRMMTYMIQLEYESNPGSTQVNPAASYLTETINKRNSIYGEAEVKMLQGILNKYGVVVGQDKNGNDIIGIDNQALYNSFNKAEKAALKTMRGINDGLTEMAQHTASVIRGQSISPLNNYVHLRVMTDLKPEDAATATILQNTYSNSLRPSTKAKNLEERTKGAKPINFDVYASVQSGAKNTMLDFFMTDAVRTARGTISEAANMLEQGPKLTKEQKDTLNAVENVFEEVLKNVLTNSFAVDGLADLITGEIVKQGYRAVLASTKKFSAELLSNISYAAAHPQEFLSGLSYGRYLNSSLGPEIMMNVNSTATNRTYNAESLSGRLVDTTALSQSSGIKSSRAKGAAANMLSMIYNRSLKKGKNVVELTADALISTPDKLVMRPIWFGAFANEFKKQTGTDVDFDMIAANDEIYIQDNAEAIAAARSFADEQSVLAGATNNPFMAITKGTAKTDMKTVAKFYHNFNNYMTTFKVFEFNAARQGIYAAMGNGTMTRARGVSLLAACTMRMTSYTLLTGMFAGGVVGLVAGYISGKKKDDDDDKTISQKLGQSAVSTITGLVLGRDFGNATTTILNYAIESANEEYLTSLRKEVVDPKTGEVTYEYDAREDNIAYSVLPGEDDPKDFLNLLMNLSGSSAPMVKTAAFAWKKFFEEPKKEDAAIERQRREITQRLPLEVLGNIGLIPLYKEFKELLLNDIYESLKEEKKQEAINAKEAEREKKRLQGYESRSDMERYNPELYEKTFGPSSPDFAEDEAKREAERLKREGKQAEKDKKYGYDPNAIPTKEQMTRKELKKYFPEEYDRKYGKYSPTYEEEKAEREVSKQERDARERQLDAYYGYPTKPKNEIKEQMDRERDAMREEFNEQRRRMRRQIGL